MNSAPVKLTARAQQQRARIVAAARGCFAEHGFQGASIGAIAKSAAMSQGLIYRYFTNKAAIVRAIVEEQRAGRSNALSGLSACQQLVDAVMDKLERWRQGPAPAAPEFDPILFLEITAEASRDAEVAKVLALQEGSIWSELAEIVRRELSAGGRVLCEAAIQERTLVLRCLIDGMIINWVRDPHMDAALMRRSLSAICSNLLALDPSTEGKLGPSN